MKGRYVSPKPSSARNCAPCTRRTRSTLSKSTSTAVATWALVAFDRTMCSAVRRRMLSNGMRSSPVSTRAGAGATGVGRAPGADGRPRASTSRRVTRPSSPVPVMVLGSSPRSVIMRRTSGEVTRPAGAEAGGRAAGAGAGAGGAGDGAGAGGGLAAGAGAGAGAAGAGGGADAAGAGGGLAGGAGAGAGGGAGAGAASAAGAAAAGAGAPSPSPTTARRAPTSTVSPSGTTISVSTPATGEGTSESTLSVDTSNSGSSTATWSPTFFNHFVIVPSVTVSPNWGIVTSTSSSLRASVQRTAGQRERRLAEQLAQRRVRVDQRAEVVGRRLPVHGEVALGDELRGPGPRDVHAEDRPVALGHDLHHAVGLADDERPPVADEPVRGGHDVVPPILGGLLGE